MLEREEMAEEKRRKENWKGMKNGKRKEKRRRKERDVTRASMAVSSAFDPGPTVRRRALSVASFNGLFCGRVLVPVTRAKPCHAIMSCLVLRALVDVDAALRSCQV
jgi:hypothetical protein